MGAFTRLALTIAIVLIPSVSFAQSFRNPLGFQFILDMVKALVTGIIYVGTPALAVFIVWSGFLFVSAQGNADGLKKAKETFLIVILGGCILLGLWAIVTLTKSTVMALGSAGMLVVFIAGYFYIRGR